MIDNTSIEVRNYIVIKLQLKLDELCVQMNEEILGMLLYKLDSVWGFWDVDVIYPSEGGGKPYLTKLRKIATYADFDYQSHKWIVHFDKEEFRNNRIEQLII